MKLDFWFLLIIALIGIASILTAWMLSEHFRLEKERMEQETVSQINHYDEEIVTGYHKTETKVERKVLATATVKVLPLETGMTCCVYRMGALVCESGHASSTKC